MGHKVHPVGFRLGITHEHQARWYARKGVNYRQMLNDDIRLRRAVLRKHPDGGISRVEIERTAQEVTVTIHSARPGIIIGRGGQRVEELRKDLEALSGKRVRINIQEIRQPETDAQLVAASIAEQIGRRVSYRRSVKQAMQRTLQAGALGIRVEASGRLGGAEIARQEKGREGRVPLHTLRAFIDYGFSEARTAMGRIGIKVWIYRGDVLPQRQARVVEGAEPMDKGAQPRQEGQNAPA